VLFGVADRGAHLPWERCPRARHRATNWSGLAKNGCSSPESGHRERGSYFRVCEWFRMPAHRTPAGCTGAGVPIPGSTPINVPMKQ
jgi:hypothetical protein